MEATNQALINKALSKTKIQMMSDPRLVFFTTVSLSLNHKWDESIPTACTNGVDIRYNPSFFMSLNPAERLFLLLHETLHVAFNHMARLKDLDPRRWNYATDYVINAILKDYGLRMPEGGLYDKKYAGMHAEAVYALITPEECEDFEMDLMESPHTPEETKEHIDRILVRANIQAERAGQAGNIPGDLKRYINELLNPTLPLARILSKFLAPLKNRGYNYNIPNRRYFPKYYLPSRDGTGVGEIAMFLDASGSVSQQDFTKFVSEAYPVVTRLKPKKLLVGQFDTEVKSVDVVTTAAGLLNVDFKGFGGTDIVPVLDWADENKPQVIIIFTDGCFEHRPQKPKCPVIWIIHGNPNWKAPYGQVIYMK